MIRSVHITQYFITLKTTHLLASTLYQISHDTVQNNGFKLITSVNIIQDFITVKTIHLLSSTPIACEIRTHAAATISAL